ncbi:MAG: hypothetical protein Q6373_016945 [Candidatus Sigynarchaeota archaeon]
MLQKVELVKKNLKMIVDVHDEPRKKDKNDPYCFGKKEGKTVYKTLDDGLFEREDEHFHFFMTR